MIQLAVFDWNGTLLADISAIVEGVNKELEILGKPAVDVKTYRQYYDVPLVNFYKSMGVTPEELASKSRQISEAFHAYYEPRVARARTRSGSRSVLSQLQAKHIEQIILSNHTLEGIYMQLERLKLSPYFAAVLANEAIGKAHFAGKEARLHDYLHDDHIAPSQAVIIGDTIEEIGIGRNLGLKTVAITGGYNSTTRLRAAKPDAIINVLSDLPKVLEEF